MKLKDRKGVKLFDFLDGEIVVNEEIPIDENIVFIEDTQRWDHCFSELEKADLFGLDIETFAKDSHDSEGAFEPETGEIRIISIGLKSGLSMVVDLGAYNSDRGVVREKYLPLINLLDEILPDPRILKVIQNAAFEYKWFRKKFNIQIRGVLDTMLMSQIYWAGLHLGLTKGRKGYKPNALDSIASRLGIDDSIEKSDETQKSDWGVPILTNKQINYAAKDALVILDCAKELHRRIQSEGLQTPFEATMKAMPAFGEMGTIGVPVCRETWGEVYVGYKDLLDRKRSEFDAAFPGVNPGSPKQLLEALQTRYPETIFTGTDDKNLADLAQTEEPIQALLLWRSMGTQVAYLEGVRDRWEYVEKYDFYFVRSNYTQIARTAMGRSGCSKINIQNPSNLKPEWKKHGLKAVRTIFKAPPGYKIIISDLAQAHAQIGRHASNDPAMQAAFKEGKDVHLLTAVTLANQKGLSWDYAHMKAAKKDETHPDYDTVVALRNISKNVNYGSLNLQSAKTLQATAATGDPPVFIPDEDAKQGIQAWKETYPGMVKFQRSTIRTANQFNHRFTYDGIPVGVATSRYGEVRSLCGRRLFLEKLPEHDFNTGELRGYGVKGTDCVSMVWMGTEATAMNYAMGEFQAWLDNRPTLNCRIIRMCHDEINLIVKDEDAEECAEKLKKIMDAGMNQFIEYENSDSALKSICGSLAEK